VCHEKAEWVLGFHARCLFGRLDRAMATERDFQMSSQSKYNRQNLLGLNFLNVNNFRPSMKHEIKHAEIKRPRCLLQVHTSTVFLKIHSKLSKHLFSIIDLAKCAPRIKKK
jgi:hypothetical protein